jgi:hypothetical protein
VALGLGLDIVNKSDPRIFDTQSLCCRRPYPENSVRQTRVAFDYCSDWCRGHVVIFLAARAVSVCSPLLLSFDSRHAVSLALIGLDRRRQFHCPVRTARDEGRLHPRRPARCAQYAGLLAPSACARDV